MTCLEQEAAAALACHAPPPPNPEDQDANYKAAIIANIHAQAATVQNINALVPVTLDLLSWLFNTSTVDLMGIVHEHASTTACSTWLGIEQQFFGNRETRCLHPKVKFLNFLQGDPSIGD